MGYSESTWSERRLSGAPFLDADLLGPRPGLRGDQLLEIANGVVLAARTANIRCSLVAWWYSRNMNVARA